MELTDVFWELAESEGVHRIVLKRSCGHKKANTVEALQKAGRTPALDSNNIPICVVCQQPSIRYVEAYTYDEHAKMNHLDADLHARRVNDTAAAEKPVFSPQILPLQRLLQKEKRPQNRKDFKIRSRDFITSYFQSCNLEKQSISSLSDATKDFVNLTELSISNNRITVLENLPPSLRVLNASGNRIRLLDLESSNGLNGALRPPLLHMGLGYNELNNCLATVAFSSTLKSLDVSYNNLCSLMEVITVLRQLKQLEYLWIAGNPLCLSLSYPLALAHHCPSLKLLEGYAVETDLISNIPRELFETEFASANVTRPSTVDTKSSETTPRMKKGQRAPAKGRNMQKKDQQRDEEDLARKAEAEASKRWRNMERELVVKHLMSNDGLALQSTLTVSIPAVSGIPDPQAEMEEKIGALEKKILGRFEALNKAVQGKGDKDKKKATPKPKEATRKVKKGGKGAVPEETESRRLFETGNELECQNEAGDDLTVQTALTMEVTYFLQYRLVGEDMYRTPEFEWKKDVQLNYKNIVEFTTSSEWRDLFLLLGVDIVLYRKVVTTSKVDITTVTHVLVPQETAADATEEPLTSRGKSSARKQSPTKKGQNKKKVSDNKYKDETKEEKEEKVDIDVTVVGSLHIGTSSFCNPHANSNTIMSLDIRRESVEFELDAQEFQHDTIHPRWVPKEYQPAPEEKKNSAAQSMSIAIPMNPPSVPLGKKAEPVEAPPLGPNVSCKLGLNMRELFGATLLKEAKDRFIASEF